MIPWPDYWAAREEVERERDEHPPEPPRPWWYHFIPWLFAIGFYGGIVLIAVLTN